MKFNNKKGQFAPIVALTTIAVLLGIFVITATVLTGVTDEVRAQQLDGVGTNTTYNETITWANGTYVSLSKGAGAASLTCTAVFLNNTPAYGGGGLSQNFRIDSGNYTCDTSGINLSQSKAGLGSWGAGGVNASNQINVTYYIKPATEEWNVSSRGLTGQLKLADQMPNLGTVAAIIGLITLLMAGIALIRRRD